MTLGLASNYADLRSRKCHERGCNVLIPRSFSSYCGEDIRDRLYGSQDSQPISICDCIITDSGESKISLVELKHHKGKQKLDDAKHIRKQFEGGLIALSDIMKGQQNSNIDLQLILFTNGKFAYSSEQRAFVKPLSRFKGTICKSACCKALPKKYQTFHFSIDGQFTLLL